MCGENEGQFQFRYREREGGGRKEAETRRERKRSGRRSMGREQGCKESGAKKNVVQNFQGKSSRSHDNQVPRGKGARRLLVALKFKAHNNW